MSDKLSSFVLVFYLAAVPAYAGLSEGQLEALSKYVGKTYWVAPEIDKRPPFLSAPSPTASPFQPQAMESFKITAIVSRSAQTPYYKVEFDSGKEGYIPIDSFLEGLNAAFVTYDPEWFQKRKASKEAQEQSKREAWIRAQPWPEHIKEAALQRRAVLGMNRNEAKVALGSPNRVVKLKSGALLGEREQWTYEGGPILFFTNGVLTRMEAGVTTTE